jgi:hypothetical protein
VGKLTEENNALKTILASSEEQLVFLKKKIWNSIYFYRYEFSLWRSYERFTPSFN